MEDAEFLTEMQSSVIGEKIARKIKMIAFQTEYELFRFL